MDGHGAAMARTVCGMRRASDEGREPINGEEEGLTREQKEQETTDQEFAYEILGVFVEAFGKRIIEGLDLLPREVFGQSLEGESARDHLEDNTAERP